MLDEAELVNYDEIDDVQQTKTKSETSLLRFVMDFGFEHLSEGFIQGRKENVLV